MDSDDEVMIISSPVPRSRANCVLNVPYRNCKIEFYSKFAIGIVDKSEKFMMKEEGGELGEMIAMVCYQQATTKLPGATPQLRALWAKYPELSVTIREHRNVTDQTSYFYDPVFDVRTEPAWPLYEFTFEFAWMPDKRRLVKHMFWKIAG